MGKKHKQESVQADCLPFRKEFYAANKEQLETIENWLLRVRKMANTCKFGIYSNKMILDKFITGLEAHLLDHLCGSSKTLGITTTLKKIESYNLKIGEENKIERSTIEENDKIDDRTSSMELRISSCKPFLNQKCDASPVSSYLICLHLM